MIQRKVKAPEQVPLVPLRSTVVYPLGVIGVQIGMPSTLEMLTRYPQDGLMVAVVVAPGGHAGLQSKLGGWVIAYTLRE